jgi:hypothetical protein
VEGGHGHSYFLCCSALLGGGRCYCTWLGRLGIIHPIRFFSPVKDSCRSVCALRFAYSSTLRLHGLGWVRAPEKQERMEQRSTTIPWRRLPLEPFGLSVVGPFDQGRRRVRLLPPPALEPWRVEAGLD